MNIPNLITFFRILLIPFFINCLICRYDKLALAILVLAFISDGLDGLLARLANQRTLLGMYLDPIADKLLLMASFITLSIINLIPVWVSVILVSRDTVLVFGAIFMDKVGMGVNISPTLAGKSSTVVQFLYLLLVLLSDAFSQNLSGLFPLLIIMVFLTVGSGFHYLYRGFIK
jgi:cardiolipin synthase